MGRGPSPTVALRNAEIVRLHLDGLNLSEIADLYGLTRERVRQVVAAAGQPTLTRERFRAVREAKQAAAEERRRVRASAVRVPAHGTRYEYTLGCRCDACVQVQRDYQKSLRGRTPPTHGLSGYTNYGCRCDVCSRAQSEINAHYREVYRKRGVRK